MYKRQIVITANGLLVLLFFICFLFLFCSSFIHYWLKAVIAHSAVDKGYEENSHHLSENPKSFLFVVTPVTKTTFVVHN